MNGRTRSLWHDLTAVASNAREHGLSTTRARALLRRETPRERDLMREIQRLRTRVTAKRRKRVLARFAKTKAKTVRLSAVRAQRRVTLSTRGR